MVDVDTVLDAVPVLAGQERRTVPLPGGLTNTNVRVCTSSGLDVVVRISETSTGLLGVDRHAEFVNTLAAARAGVGAPVVDFLEGRGVLVVEHLPGRTWGAADVAANLPRFAAAISRLHTGQPFVGRFDMSVLRRQYLDTVRAQGFSIPEGFLDLEPAVAEAEAVLGLRPEPLVACHNDLLAANVLDDGGDLRIIDYEYSGMNEPAFDLGNAAAESGLDPDALAALCAAYYGREDPADAARAELWGFVAAYGWVLWGVIQGSTSAIDVDFAEWTAGKLEDARRFAGAARFPDVLAAGAGR